MFFKNKNVLVSGASGFVGTNLIKRLLELEANVYGVLHHKKPLINFNSDRINYKWKDLTNKQNCQEVVRGMDYVFMCASNEYLAGKIEEYSLTSLPSNVIMDTLMLEAAYRAKVKKVLFISSATVYPLSNSPLKENDFNGNLFNKYFCIGWMKRFLEIMCEMYSTRIKNPITTIVIRPGSIYGEYDNFEWEKAHSTPALIRKVIERHNPLEVWGDGSDIKDLLYISDLIDGLILAMEKIEKFDILNLASGRSYSIKETLETILEVDNYTDAKIIFDKSKPIMIPIRMIDISKAKRILRFNPKINLNEGIKRTIEWYKKNKK